jgi:tetratricopeptide (TPR) repeat protein
VGAVLHTIIKKGRFMSAPEGVPYQRVSTQDPTEDPILSPETSIRKGSLENGYVLCLLDQVADFIPGVSFISNLINALIKAFFLDSKEGEVIEESQYLHRLKYKPYTHCLLLAIPGVNFFIVAFDAIKTHQGNTLLEGHKKTMEKWSNNNFEDLDAALRWGNPEAAYLYGVIYHKQGNFKEAFSCFKQAADQGHREAALELGRLYTDPTSGLFSKKECKSQKNLKQALKYLERSMCTDESVRNKKSNIKINLDPNYLHDDEDENENELEPTTNDNNGKRP